MGCICFRCLYRIAVKWLFFVQSYLVGWNLSSCGVSGVCSYHDQVIRMGGSGGPECGT